MLPTDGRSGARHPRPPHHLPGGLHVFTHIVKVPGEKMVHDRAGTLLDDYARKDALLRPSGRRARIHQILNSTCYR